MISRSNLHPTANNMREEEHERFSSNLACVMKLWIDNYIRSNGLLTGNSSSSSSSSGGLQLKICFNLGLSSLTFWELKYFHSNIQYKRVHVPP